MKSSGLLKHISIIVLLFSTQVISQELYLIRIHKPSEQFVNKCISNNAFIAALDRYEHIDLVVYEDEFESLSNRFDSVTVLDTISRIQSRLAKSTTVADGYHTYSSMLEEMQKLEKEYPQFCKLYDIGDSRGKQYTPAAYDQYKHDIWAMKVSDNVEKDEDEPRFLYMANMHGWEIASLEVCLAILNNYLKNYSTNSELKQIVDNSELWFVPLVNPDGHKIPQRKNIYDNNKNSRFDENSEGVDLNRNYTYYWGKGSATHEASANDYCGPSAGSEPETECMIKLFEEKRFVADISYHLYSELVLWPYGYATTAVAPDDAALSDLGKLIASKLERVNRKGETYKPTKITGLYPASGSKEDYAYATFGTFSYCIELYNLGFDPPVADMKKLREDNLDAALEMPKRITYATLTGIITDKTTKKPIEAVIYVKEIDDTIATKRAWRAPYKSNKDFGRYYRFLMPGSYTVTISAQGYKDTTFNNVLIEKDKPTVLDIVMSSQTSHAVLKKLFGTSVSMAKCIRNGTVNITMTGHSNTASITIFNTSGKMITRINDIHTDDREITWNIGNLANGTYYMQLRSLTEFEYSQFTISR